MLTYRWDSEGQSSSFQTYNSSSASRADGAGAQNNVRLDELKTIGQVKDEGLGTNDKVDYFTVSAVVSFVKQETFSYPACANPDGCNKKMQQDMDEKWRCEKCDKVYDDPIHRYVWFLRLSIMREQIEVSIGIHASCIRCELRESGGNAVTAPMTDNADL
jgi:replication factor A1